MMEKRQVLEVTLHHEGVFTPNPLEYHDGDADPMVNVDFTDLSIEQVKRVLSRATNLEIKGLYYCVPTISLNAGLREMKNDAHIHEFQRIGLEKGGKMDLYTDHYGYDIMSWLGTGGACEGSESEEEDSDIEIEDDVLPYLQLHNEGEDNVDIRHKSISDPFLTKLCFGNFISSFDDEVVYDPHDPHRVGGSRTKDSLDESEIDPKYKTKEGVYYPIHNPDQDWNLMKPILGMRFENAAQLRTLMINYGVANGYQLWYAKSDWSCMLVKCGRNVDAGRCASRNRKRNKALKKDNMKEGESSQQGAKKAKKLTPVKGKKKLTPLKGKKMKKGTQLECPFRLWASWMSGEKSFQIKSLIPDHKCTRNFNLNPLVNYKWIARMYSKEILENKKLSMRQMRADIKSKFLINVSLGQCTRAKQRALYDYEGGLKEHYARLWDYQKAILDSNPGSTVKIETESIGSGVDQYFLRMYICFKGVKDGWQAGCRRVIGLDGCFLKSTVKGELLTAMGRDANNQMYPIAWAVVNVENRDNWCWFLASLSDDLQLYNGHYLTIISDGHKGLIEAVKTWLPAAEHRQCTRHIYMLISKEDGVECISEAFSGEQHLALKLPNLKEK